MPTVRSLVVAMFVEELRLFSRAPADIILEVVDGLAAPTIQGAENAVYFTREQFAARLCFLVPYLVKQFLHFTGTPPALVYPNVFQILMSCSVLNLLYHLNISLIEICFIYSLKLGIGGCLSMSAHSPRLQFVTRLPDSPKIESRT